MKFRILCVLVLLAGFSIPASAQVKHVKVGVNGLVCAVCSFSVEKALGKRDDIASAKVDLKDKTVTISLKPGFAFNPESIRQTIKKAGFQTRDFELVAQGRIVRTGGTYEFALEGTTTRYTLRAPMEDKLPSYEGKTIQLRARVVREKPAIELEVLDVAPASGE